MLQSSSKGGHRSRITSPSDPTDAVSSLRLSGPFHFFCFLFCLPLLLFHFSPFLGIFSCLIAIGNLADRSSQSYVLRRGFVLVEAPQSNSEFYLAFPSQIRNSEGLNRSLESLNVSVILHPPSPPPPLSSSSSSSSRFPLRPASTIYPLPKVCKLSSNYFWVEWLRTIAM